LLLFLVTRYKICGISNPADTPPTHHIVACCSGKAATDRWYGWKAASEENWLKSRDQREAFRVALQLSGGDALCAGMLMRWAEKRAEILVADHWNQLSDAAHTLLERGKLKIE